MTANRPLSPTRRPQPRTHTQCGGPASHDAQNTQPRVRLPRASEPAQVLKSSPDVRPMPDSRAEEARGALPVGAPEHEGHPVTFSSAPRGLGFSRSSRTGMILQTTSSRAEKTTDGQGGLAAALEVAARGGKQSPGRSPRRPQLPRARPRD